jgi:hypothetical protein
MLNLVNIITVTFALFSTVIAVRLYILVRAPALLMLAASVSCLALVRISVAAAQSCGEPNWVTQNTSYLLVPFWPLLSVSLWLLLRSLRNLLAGNGFRK